MKLQRANYRHNDLTRLEKAPPDDHPALRFGERCRLIGGLPGSPDLLVVDVDGDKQPGAPITIEWKDPAGKVHAYTILRDAVRRSARNWPVPISALSL